MCLDEPRCGWPAAAYHTVSSLSSGHRAVAEQCSVTLPLRPPHLCQVHGRVETAATQAELDELAGGRRQGTLLCHPAVPAVPVHSYGQRLGGSLWWLVAVSSDEPQRRGAH